MASDKRLDQVKLVNSAESVLVVNGDQVEKAALAGFANSMGSSVPLQQTSEQVSITGLYARTNDGKMVELTSDSVAQVMAGLMGNPIGNKGSASNAHTALEAGWYRIVGSTTGLPQGFYRQGTIMVYGKNEANERITQIASDVLGVVYSRTADVGTSPLTTLEHIAWKRLDNFGYNTLAELSAGVAGKLGSSIVNTDADLLPTGFFSTAGSGNTNLPTNFGYGVILCFDCGMGNRKIQIAFSPSTSKLYIRICEITVWKSWIQIN